MNIGVVTLFPEMFREVLQLGVLGRAVQKGQVNFSTLSPREFTGDRHRTVDDRPYGGGPGMLMMAPPLVSAIRDLDGRMQAQGAGRPRRIYLSPQGQPLNQAMVERLAGEPGLLLVAGRYEGIDERIIESEIDEEISLGDFVLSGGEIAVMAVIDAVVRQLPGVLGHSESAQQDSFVEGLLDHPHYTRPESFEGRQVPEVLLSGDHEKIRRWRRKQALGRTYQRRPDLLDRDQLDDEGRQLLAEYLREKGIQV